MNLKVDLIDLTAGNVEIALSKIDGSKESETSVQTQKSEILTVTASIKPFINLVWIGVAVMVLGFFVAVSRRLKESLIKS